MKTFSLIKKNSYYDSVTLMGISKRLGDLGGVEKISVSMGTELNKTLLQDSGMSTPDSDAATPNDLIIAYQLQQEELADDILETIEKTLIKRSSVSTSTAKPVGIKSALNASPDANMVIISLPGEYAVLEAKKALENDLHVMMFSDNVSIEDELMLKTLAHEKGLLVMGPDCGTAIINQKALCFANVISKGRIGIVGASGTGTQEISVLLDQNGVGMSQVIGTGGRDLHKSIGGIMMCDALQALADDPETDLIILVSKPPEGEVADKVYTLAKHINKPVVACFLNEGESQPEQGNIHFANTLEEGARKAIGLFDSSIIVSENELPKEAIRAAAEKVSSEQKYVRGLFCGGTLTEEARIIFKQECPTLPCFGNTAKKVENKLVDPLSSQCNTFLDMGDDAFTVGKPHPMIDPEPRNERIAKEAADPETAVILVDIVLGYGSHEDPAGVTLEGIREAQEIARRAGREVVFVGYVLGSSRDPQGLNEQHTKLVNAGVILGESNVHAARIAAEIIKEIQ